jgi:hypothetical protein
MSQTSAGPSSSCSPDARRRSAFVGAGALAVLWILLALANLYLGRWRVVVTPDQLNFIQVLRDLGVPGFGLLLTVLAVVFGPALLKMVKSKTKQTETMTATLPRIENHLHDMARSGSASQGVLEELLRGQQRHETKLDKLLDMRR